MRETNEQGTITANRGSKFLKDIGIYAIGNIGSKLITLMMVPLYTHFVHKTSDFGYYDDCLQICFLLIPFLTLQLRDGAFRFLLDCDDRKQRERIVSFVAQTLAISLTMTLLIALVLSMFVHIPYLGYIVALLVAMSLQEVYSQVFRGLGNNRAFVTVGILSALGIGLFSIILVAGLGWGIKGIFLANIFARILALVIVESRVRLITRHTRWHLSTKKVARDIIRYTLPLMPGSLCWWLTGSSDRMFLTYFLGLDITGIYAIAIRFTGVIYTLAIIFYQAWQETAILQYHSPDRNRFFSKMLNSYILLLAIIFIGYVFALKVNYSWLVADAYRESINYIYPLGLSAVVFAVAAFFDMGYQCALDTKRTLPAIVLAAIVNVVLNFLLIKPLGVYGVITTQLITYLVLVTYRWHDMKRYFVLKIEPRTSIPVLAMLLSGITYYCSHSIAIDILFSIAIIAFLGWLYRNDLRDLWQSKIIKTHNRIK